MATSSRKERQYCPRTPGRHSRLRCEFSPACHHFCLGVSPAQGAEVNMGSPSTIARGTWILLAALGTCQGRRPSHGNRRMETVRRRMPADAESLLCARHCTKLFALSIALNPPNKLMRPYYYHPQMRRLRHREV